MNAEDKLETLLRKRIHQANTPQELDEVAQTARAKRMWRFIKDDVNERNRLLLGMDCPVVYGNGRRSVVIKDRKQIVKSGEFSWQIPIRDLCAVGYKFRHKVIRV